MTSAPSETAFSAVLYPNQPLDRRNFVQLMVCTGVVVAFLSAAFFAAGAWPVSGFLGLDLLLLYMAFRWTQREAGRRQVVTLDRRGLHVEALDHRGRRSYTRLEPYWVRVDIDDPPNRRSLVSITSRGERLELGHFLTPEDRLDFARALRQALRNYRGISN